MSVAVVLITHEKIASSMLSIATSIVHDALDNLTYIEIPMDASVETMELELVKKIDDLDIKNGIIIITDMYGGTPCNIAKRIKNKYNAALVSGLNLPMLIKLLNYRDLPLEEISQKIVSGGQNCINIHEE